MLDFDSLTCIFDSICLISTLLLHHFNIQPFLYNHMHTHQFLLLHLISASSYTIESKHNLGKKWRRQTKDGWIMKKILPQGKLFKSYDIYVMNATNKTKLIFHISSIFSTPIFSTKLKLDRHDKISIMISIIW